MIFCWEEINVQKIPADILDKELDPEQKWVTTYNDYLHRLKHFLGGFITRRMPSPWMIGKPQTFYNQ